MENSTAQANNSIAPNSYIKEPYVLEIFRLIFVTSVAIVGVFGSITVCLVAPSSKKKRSAGSLYIRSLAAADIGNLVVNLPIAIIKEQSPFYWPLGKEVCFVFYPLMELFHGACIWSIVAIAIERYMGIINTKKQSLKSIRIIVSVIWIASFVFLVFPLLFTVRHVQTPIGTFCFFAWPSPLSHDVYNVMDTVTLYILPLITITFTYLRITRAINVSSNLHKRLSSQTEVRRREEMRRVRQNARTKKLLTPLVLVFTITMLPVNVFRVMLIFWKSFTSHKLFLIFYNICVLGIVVNSAADPIIYSIVTKDFHSRLKAFFAKRSFSRDGPSSTTWGMRNATVKETLL